MDEIPEYPFEEKDLIEPKSELQKFFDYVDSLADKVGIKQERPFVDQDKIIKWLDDHKKDIALVVVTALVTSKFNRRNSGTNAILQTQDGSVWVLPTKNS